MRRGTWRVATAADLSHLARRDTERRCVIAGKLQIRDESTLSKEGMSICGLCVGGFFREGDWVLLPSPTGTPARWRVASVIMGMARDAQGMPYTPFRLHLPGVPKAHARWLRTHLTQGQVLEVEDPDPSFAEPVAPTPVPARPWWRRWFASDV